LPGRGCSGRVALFAFEALTIPSKSMPGMLKAP
jgi:hypothetical protein